MKTFSVVVRDTGQEVWTGEAEHPLDACRRAARAGNAGVGTFFTYTGGNGEKFDLKHLVPNVYDASAPPPADPEDVDDASLVGSYAARYVD